MLVILVMPSNAVYIGRSHDQHGRENTRRRQFFLQLTSPSSPMQKMGTNATKSHRFAGHSQAIVTIIGQQSQPALSLSLPLSQLLSVAVILLSSPLPIHYRYELAVIAEHSAAVEPLVAGEPPLSPSGALALLSLLWKGGFDEKEREGASPVD